MSLEVCHEMSKKRRSKNFIVCSGCHRSGDIGSRLWLRRMGNRTPGDPDCWLALGDGTHRMRARHRQALVAME